MTQAYIHWSVAQFWLSAIHLKFSMQFQAKINGQRGLPVFVSPVTFWQLKTVNCEMVDVACLCGLLSESDCSVIDHWPVEDITNKCFKRSLD